MGIPDFLGRILMAFLVGAQDLEHMLAKWNVPSRNLSSLAQWLSSLVHVLIELYQHVAGTCKTPVDLRSTY